MPREVTVVEKGVFGRIQRSTETLVVDLAVTGETDRQKFPVPARGPHLQQHILQCFGGGDGPAQRAVGPLHQSCDGRGVAGGVHDRIGQTVGPRGGRRGRRDRLDVGRVPRFHAADEGVLTDLGLGQELLRGAAAHGARHRRDDHVANPHAREHLLIRLAVGQIHPAQSGVVGVEGVGVLHDELPAAQDPGARACLVAVFRLNLEQQNREILVGAVLALDGQGEQFLVGGPEQVVVVAAVLEPEDPVAVLGPAVGRLVRGPRQQRREQDLLATDGDHLLAHHVLDLAQHPQAQRQPAVEAGRDRADIAGPDQQLVAGNFGVGRVVAQRAQEQLGHAGDHSGQA